VDDERSIVEGVLRGESAPFVTLVRRYQGLVYHVIGALVRNPADQEELCQETFLRIHRKLHTFEEGSLKAWVAKVARNIALNHLRRRAIRQEQLTESISSDYEEQLGLTPIGRSPVEQGLLARSLRSAVERLPLPSRDVVKLFYFEELSVGEVAALLEIPTGTVKSHLFRARRALQAQLKGGPNGRVE
jgi:RNA polymerase sigma-70 factor (ECF subfamily)